MDTPNTGGNNTEVVLKLNVQSEQGEKNLKKLGKAADETTKKADKLKKSFDAVTEAQKRLAAADREQQVRSAMKSMRPDSSPMDRARQQMAAAENSAAVGRARQQLEYQKWRQKGVLGRSVIPPGYGMAAARVAGGVTAVVGAAHHIFGTTTQHINEMGERTAARIATGQAGLSANETLKDAVYKGVPVVGSLAKAIEDMATASQKAAAKMSLASREIEQRRTDTFIGQTNIRYGANEEIRSLGLGRADAATVAAAKERYAASLTPGRLAQFSSAAGGEYRAIAQARAETEIAEGQLGSRRSANAGAKQSYATARANAERLTRQADISQREAAQATAAKNRWLAGSGHTTMGGTGAKLAGEETDAINRAGADKQAADMARNNLERASEVFKRTASDEAEASKKVVEAKTREAQASLGLARRDVGQNRAGAIKFGMGTKAEVFQYAGMARQFEQFGAKGLTPEQMQVLAGGPLRDQVEDAARKQGDQWSQDAGIGAIKGRLTGRLDNGLPLQDQEDKVERAGAGLEAAGARDKFKIADEAATQLAGIIRDVMTMAIRGLEQKFHDESQHRIQAQKAN